MAVTENITEMLHTLCYRQASMYLSTCLGFWLDFIQSLKKLSST